MQKACWLGALYCDAQFGITDQLLQVQKIGRYHSDQVELEYKVSTLEGIRKYTAIPLRISKEWLRHGFTETLDQVIIVISDSHHPFDLSYYNQEKIEFDNYRNPGFSQDFKFKNKSWRTIYNPIQITISEES